MPRVNRDLQRRLAARRERDRRRPAPERRYRFQTAPPDEADVDLAQDAAIDGTPQQASEPRTRRGQSERPAARPFSEYALDYAYVASDLRRLAYVVGAILVILIVIYFVLPR